MAGPILINNESFSAGGADMGDIILAIAASIAKMAAAPLANLTDNSGGAANGTVSAIPLCVTAPTVGANVPTKAAAEAAFGTIKDALTEIAGQIVNISAKVPAFTPTNSIGGAAPDLTIGAITIAPAADNVGPRVSFAGFNAVATAAATLVADLLRDVNTLADACGIPEIAGIEASMFVHAYPALATDTGAAPADSSGSVTVGESTATLTAFRDAVAEMAATLNLITSDNVPLAVVIDR